jgi:phospholipase C
MIERGFTLMKKFLLFTGICLILAACSPVYSLAQTQSTAVYTATGQGSSSATPQLPSATGTASPSTATPVSSTSTPSLPAGKVPDFDHIILIVLENESYGSVIGSSKAPHLNALANQYVLMTDYYAVTHPSLPNYIALMSGSTQGITSDCNNCFFNAQNLGNEITASGKTWKAYEESMPSPCYVGNSGLYAQKHDPLIYFDSIRQDTALCQKSIVPMTQLTKDLADNQLPNFAFIMPNLCNSAHDCPISTADTWVDTTVKELQSSPALGSNYLIIITFDEGTSSDKSSCCGMPGSAGGKVATILISPQARLGFKDSTRVSHYGLLKTILDAWNLPDIGNTSNPGTQPILAPWK